MRRHLLGPRRHRAVRRGVRGGGRLEKLEAFASIHGAHFYGLPRNGGTITLVPEAWEVPASYPFGTEELVPLRAGERVAWRLAP